jgi:peptidoglycan/LPS O-acetylase OafA/YrhL
MSREYERFAGWRLGVPGDLDGTLRLTVSFVMGLWLYRIQGRIRRPKIGLLVLSILLIVIFQAPKFSNVGGLSFNGLYDAACVLFLFPLIIICGVHSDAGAGMMRLCKFSGRLSYPLYITHIGVHL